MYLIIIAVFVIGYFFIAMEHPFKIDKSASAILTGVLCWTLLIFGMDSILPGVTHEEIDAELLKHVGEIAQILFFLLGAMTIVELIDVHDGFEVVTNQISTNKRIKLIWIISILTFFFSAVLDNLTTAIVMAALLRKLMSSKENIWIFGGMVIIAANAGGAWSPIGDVTTIMLWIGGQVTALNIIIQLFLPSVVCLLVPLLILTFYMKGDVVKPVKLDDEFLSDEKVSSFEQKLVFWMGVGGLLFVPIFKNVTHLPPFLGMLFSLGVLWVTTELMHRRKFPPAPDKFLVGSVIRRIDTPSVLFFLGILMAVACLQTAGHLGDMAKLMEHHMPNIYAMNTMIGLMSAVVDNVPLVAGAMGMYPLDVYPPDHRFWELLAFCAGTGGSILIIGSAAGVAIMGLLKIDFIWYVKRISLLALAGYFAGIVTFWLLNGY